MTTAHVSSRNERDIEVALIESELSNPRRLKVEASLGYVQDINAAGKKSHHHKPVTQFLEIGGQKCVNTPFGDSEVPRSETCRPTLI